MVAGYGPANRPVTSEPAGKTESGEALVLPVKIVTQNRWRSAAPGDASSPPQITSGAIFVHQPDIFTRKFRMT
jgi:hypothetical protein